MKSGQVRPGRFSKPGRKDHLVWYFSGGKLRPDGREGVIAGPLKGDLLIDRDKELCKRIHEQTEFGVRCESYDVGSRRSDDDRIPHAFIQGVYKYAQENGYRWLHLVGFSGGGAVASSQLVYHSNKNGKMVQSLVIIGGPIAEHTGDPKGCVPHTNAADYADRIAARTLLIYGKQDPLRRGIAAWKEKNDRAELFYYEGDHDFGKRGERSFERVSKKVIDWLKKSPDQGDRSIRLRMLRTRTEKRRRRAKKQVGTR